MLGLFFAFNLWLFMQFSLLWQLFHFRLQSWFIQVYLKLSSILPENGYFQSSICSFDVCPTFCFYFQFNAIVILRVLFELLDFQVNLILFSFCSLLYMVEMRFNFYCNNKNFGYNHHKNLLEKKRKRMYLNLLNWENLNWNT